jgi:hypothetical protein
MYTFDNGLMVRALSLTSFVIISYGTGSEQQQQQHQGLELVAGVYNRYLEEALIIYVLYRSIYVFPRLSIYYIMKYFLDSFNVA